MASPSPGWRVRSDVAWIGDENRVIAARTSPADPDGPRILAGSAAWVWVRLADPRADSPLVADPAHVASTIKALAAANLIERSAT